MKIQDFHGTILITEEATLTMRPRATPPDTVAPRHRRPPDKDLGGRCPLRGRATEPGEEPRRTRSRALGGRGRPPQAEAGLRIGRVKQGVCSHPRLHPHARLGWEPGSGEGGPVDTLASSTSDPERATPASPTSRARPT